VHLFGRKDAELKLVERISNFERRHSQLLQQLPADWQERVLTRQKQAASGSGEPRWTFPSAIMEEEVHRNQVGNRDSDLISSDLSSD
jgi:hypothetical protein